VKILDTDTDIEVLHGNPRVLLHQSGTAGRLATTIVSVAELFYGAAKSTMADFERGRVNRFLGSVEIVGLEEPAARIFGDLKAQLEREGRSLADADLLIAAICLAHNATLVTGNTGHFERIPGLVLEDWIRG
jgi:tRNA(fMet)-specific endonuclease VapC